MVVDFISNCRIGVIKYSLCQLHAVCPRLYVGIPVSHSETIDQVDIEEILLMWC
jgi:hypothetical protein